jgi:tetratricopeptide (TPR) repeat protein
VARAAVKAKQQTRAKAQPAKPARGRARRRRRGGGGNPNEQLFFTRLRRGQKWLYAALAIVFAATFAAVGVGSGAGSGLDQLYSGIFGGSGDAVAKAKDEIKTNPSKGYRDLATAYESKSQIGKAIQALQSYVAQKHDDAAAWTELAGLEQTQGRKLAARFQAAQSAAQLQSPGQVFQPGGTLATAFGSNPVEQYNAQTASSRTSQLYQKTIGAYTNAMHDYEQVAKLRPHSGDAQFQIATAAENAGQYGIAIKHLKRYLQLSPHSPQKKLVERAIKQLSKLLPPKQK